jgi:anti-anti-sigma factor
MRRHCAALVMGRVKPRARPSRSAVDGSAVSFSPYRLPARPAAQLDLRPSSTVIGSDGTETIKVCRYTEPAASGDHAWRVVDVSGDIDADTAPVLQAALIDAISLHHQVCCDLTGVEFFGGAGANTIMAALRYADDADHAFAIRGVHGVTAQVFRIVGLDTHLGPDHDAGGRS